MIFELTFPAVPVKIMMVTRRRLLTVLHDTRSITEQAGVTVYPEDKLTTQPVSNILEEGTIAMS